MTNVSEQQEQRLRDLLAGRAGHLQIPEPFPPVTERTQRQMGGGRLVLVAMAAVVALMAFGSARMLASGPAADISAAQAPAIANPDDSDEPQPDRSDRSDQAVTRLLVFASAGSADNTLSGLNTRADRIIEQIESTGASIRYVPVRRDITEQQFQAFWADAPDVQADRQTTWPVAFDVELDSAADLAALRTEFMAIEHVVRVEPYPLCGAEPSLFPHVCEADNRLRDFAVATVAALVILGGLVAAGRLPLRIAVVVVFVMFSAGLVLAVVRPVGAELKRAAPAVEQIRTQFGSDLGCSQWYDLEIDTRQGRLGGGDPRFENIDPGLVQVALDDGTDIYLWPVWVVPAIIAIVIMLAIAWFLPMVQPWKTGVRIAIVLVTLVGVVSLPTDFKTDQAIQCLSE